MNSLDAAHSANRSRRFVLLGITAAGLLLLLGVLQAPPGSGRTVVESFLGPRDRAELEEILARCGARGEAFLVAVRSRSAAELATDVERLEARLRSVAGIAAVLCVPALERLRAEGTFSGTIHTAPLEPRPDTQLLLAYAREGYQDPAATEALVRDVEDAVEASHRSGAEVSFTGAAAVRALSWRLAYRDLRRSLVWILVVVVLIPWWLLGSPVAVIFPLAVAAVTTAVTLAILRWFGGPLVAWELSLLPLLWAVATLDALHLFSRFQQLRRRLDLRDAARSAARCVRDPCLLTTLTTMGGLLALTLQDDSPLLRHFGLAGAGGTALAFLITFTLGPQVLVAFPGPVQSSRPSDSGLLRLIHRGLHQPWRLLGIAGVLASLAVLGATRIRQEVHFPGVFRAATPPGQNLARLGDLSGTDLSPIDLYLVPSDALGEDLIALASAMQSLNHQLHTLPETRWVIPTDLVRPAIEVQERDPDRRALELKALLRQPLLKTWIDESSGVGHLQLLLRPAAAGRRAQIIDQLGHFDETMLSHHRLLRGGMGTHYLQAERSGARAAWNGGLLSLVVLLLVLCLAFRRRSMILAAVTVNVLPALLVAGSMGFASIPWSLALLPVPAVLLGLVVDDSIHLLWPLHRHDSKNLTVERLQRVLRVAAGRSGAALCATTLVLAGSLLSLYPSMFQVNRQIAVLLPLGLLGALLADLTLLPALLRISARRSAPRRP